MPLDRQQPVEGLSALAVYGTGVSAGNPRHDLGGGIKHEVVYGLTALTGPEAGPERLRAFVRDYCGIENDLHDRRVVTLREGATRLLVSW